MAQLKSCKSCGKEVAKSAKVCPNCGQKLKHGLCFKILAGGAALAAVFFVSQAVFGPSEAEIKAQKQAIINELVQAPVANYTPNEIGQIFNMFSDSTKLQKENKLKELTGQTVTWRVPVYNVKKTSKGYTVQTSSTNGAVGLFLRVETDDPQTIAHLESLKTGDFVAFKGRFTGDSTLDNLEISPTIILVP